MVSERKIVLFAGIWLSLASVLSFLNINKYISLQDVVTSVIWWGFILIISYYALRKKSLTTWILVAMVIGIRIGLDFRDAAMELQVLSKVFLKLIKTIIAPILFATLVVGIAGHSNMKQLGRMGWKSLLYFELVTTLALVVGLVMINITKAGVGIEKDKVEITDIPKNAVKQRQSEIIQVLDSAGVAIPQGFLETLPDEKHTWQDHILNIFPENIAK